MSSDTNGFVLLTVGRQLCMGGEKEHGHVSCHTFTVAGFVRAPRWSTRRLTGRAHTLRKNAWFFLSSRRWTPDTRGLMSYACRRQARGVHLAVTAVRESEPLVPGGGGPESKVQNTNRGYTFLLLGRTRTEQCSNTLTRSVNIPHTLAVLSDNKMGDKVGDVLSSPSFPAGRCQKLFYLHI